MVRFGYQYEILAYHDQQIKETCEWGSLTEQRAYTVSGMIFRRMQMLIICDKSYRGQRGEGCGETWKSHKKSHKGEQEKAWYHGDHKPSQVPSAFKSSREGGWCCKEENNKEIQVIYFNKSEWLSSTDHQKYKVKEVRNVVNCEMKVVCSIGCEP